VAGGGAVPLRRRSGEVGREWLGLGALVRGGGRAGVLDLGRERAEAWGTMDAKMAGSNGGRDGSGARAGGSTPFIGKG
jgi:hypothetical protein